MALPASWSMDNISGKYVLNSKHTDNKQTDEILSAQGVGWVTRKVISAATITLSIKDYVDADGVEKVDIDTTLTGGIAASPEYRTLNYENVGRQENRIFGAVSGKSKRCTKAELESLHGDKEFLGKGWDEERTYCGKGMILSESWSFTEETKNKWGAVQTWGVEIIGGEPRYVRHVYFMHENGKINEKKDIKAKMVYDYIGPLDA